MFKLNWGKSIAIFYIMFVLWLLGFALYTKSEDVNLVTENYYEQELQYQDQINKINRTKNLPEQVSIKYSGDQIGLTFPDIFSKDDIEGKVHLYRPSDNKLDLFENIELDAANQMEIPVSKLAKGLWKVKVDWQVKSDGYFNEQIILVN